MRQPGFRSAEAMLARIALPITMCVASAGPPGPPRDGRQKRGAAAGRSASWRLAFVLSVAAFCAACVAGEPAEVRKGSGHGEAPDGRAVARLADSISAEIILSNAVRFPMPSARSIVLGSLASSDVLSVNEKLALGLHWAWRGTATEEHVSLSLKREGILNGRWTLERVRSLLRRKSAAIPNITPAQYRVAWGLETREVRALTPSDAKAIAELLAMIEAQATKQVLDSRRKVRALVQQAVSGNASLLQPLLRQEELIAVSAEAEPLRRAREQLKALIRRTANSKGK
jgi:hypothetical protein